MQVLGFPESLPQARQLADTLDCECLPIDVHRFPDGESLVTVPAQVQKTAVFFRSLNDPNEKLVELLLAIETARRNGCKRVILVTPYLCYMRQDMAFKPGQAISQRIIGELLSEWVDDLITVDPHLHRIHHLNIALPYCNSTALSAAPLLGDFLKAQGVKGLLVGPDDESRQWVQQVAEASGNAFVVASKERFGDRDVEVTLPDHDYNGVHAILVDDVISSGKTLMEAAQALRAKGASRISAICTHALFAPGAGQAMKDAGIDAVWSSNAIPHSSNHIDLTAILAEAIHETLGELHDTQ